MNKKTTEELLKILKSKKSFDEYLKEESTELINSTLAEYTAELIETKQLKKGDIIKRSNLDKNYAYQIFNGTKTNPSRNKVIMLAFGMGLDLKETGKLLKISGQGDLYARVPRDCVIIFGIDKKLSLMEVNEFLFDMGMEILE